jgi:hypothetical protein
MTDYPETLARAAGGAQRLQLADDLLARRGDCAPQDVSRRIATLEGDAGTHFTLLRGTPASGDIGVYRAPGSQDFAVPTGRVFLRFAEGIAASDRKADVARAGYRIAALLDYADNAAWVESADGEIASALHGLDRLAAIAGVAHVEPQLLSPRALK